MSDPLENYSWENDEGWLILLKKFEFPPNMDENKKEKFLLKKKRKYYKNKIDPNYEPPIVQENLKTDDNNNNTSSSNSKPNSNDDNIDKDEKSESQPKPEPKPEPKTEEKPKATPKPKTRPRYNSNVSILSKLLNYYYVVAQLFILIGSALSVVDPIFFRYVLFASGLTYSVSVLQNHGRPQFNQYYMERIMRDECLMIVFYSLMFLLAQPSIIFLIPLILRSVYMSAFMLNSLLNNAIPKLTDFFNKIISNGNWFTNQIAIIEVYLGIYLIICIFWMRNSIILAIMYWQINGLKYTLNNNTKTAFWKVNQTIENYLGKIPVLLNLYRKITGYMYSMVDVERLRQQAQQAQSGNSSRRCTIM